MRRTKTTNYRISHSSNYLKLPQTELKLIQSSFRLLSLWSKFIGTHVCIVVQISLPQNIVEYMAVCSQTHPTPPRIDRSGLKSRPIEREIKKGNITPKWIRWQENNIINGKRMEMDLWIKKMSFISNYVRTTFVLPLKPTLCLTVILFVRCAAAGLCSVR